MKKSILMAVLVAASVASFAAEVSVGRVANGSGTPGNVGVENAKEVYNDILHAPQYMAGYPTAATIWPRVIDVPCTKEANGNLKCDGYKWTPNLGRGEYLFVSPKVVEAPAPVVITKEVEVPGKTIYVEVEKKKLRE